MGSATDTQMVIRCLYCLTGIEFRPMIAHKDGRFVCRDCAHTVRPGVPEYMNPHSQPRISLLLRRAHGFYVSHLSKRRMVMRFRLSQVQPHAPSLCDPLLKPERSNRNGKLPNDQDRLIQIQIP